MKRASKWAFVLLAILLFAYTLVFPLLTVDTLQRIFAHASGLESRNLFLLLYLEFGRLFTTGIALIVAFSLMVTGARRRDARALALFILFAAIAYEKAFSSSVYPGPIQERIANALLHAGVSKALLGWLFGRLAWPVWPAAAALLRFSVTMPRDLDADMLQTSGALDRQGLLRGRGFAGADIGQFFRSLSQKIAAAGVYRPPALGIASIVLIAFHTFVRGAAATAVLYAIAILALSLVITNIRAGHSVAEAADRARVTWITEGFVIAVFMFLISAAALLTVPTGYGLMAAFVLIMVTPAAVIVCMALSVLDHGELDAHRAVEWTVRWGTVALAVTLVFGVLYELLSLVVGRFGMSHAGSAAVALVIAAILFRPVSRLADRARLRIMEKPQG